MLELRLYLSSVSKYIHRIDTKISQPKNTQSNGVILSFPDLVWNKMQCTFTSVRCKYYTGEFISFTFLSAEFYGKILNLKENCWVARATNKICRSKMWNYIAVRYQVTKFRQRCQFLYSLQFEISLTEKKLNKWNLSVNICLFRSLEKLFA